MLGRSCRERGCEGFSEGVSVWVELQGTCPRGFIAWTLMGEAAGTHASGFSVGTLVGGLQDLQVGA